MRDRKIKKLNKKVQSAVGIITNTIKKLETSNTELHSIYKEIDEEIDELKMQKVEVKYSIDDNTKVITNLKKLLG